MSNYNENDLISLQNRLIQDRRQTQYVIHNDFTVVCK